MTRFVTEETVKLTDDEVVALAVRAGAPWGAPTPTVDPADAAAVAAAARRGERSLYARDLLGESEAEPLGVLEERLRTALGPALDRAVRFAVYVTDPDLRWYPDALNVVYYAAGEEYVAESVSSGGVHEFARLGRDVVSRGLAELADAAMAGGVRGARDGADVDSLCIAITDGATVRVLQLSRGAAVAHDRVGAPPEEIGTDSVAAVLAAAGRA